MFAVTPTASTMGAVGHQAIAAQPLPKLSATSTRVQSSRVQIFDMSDGTERPVAAGRNGEFSDPVIQQAHKNALAVDEFLRSSFNRDGWDGKGSPLRVVVHARDEEGIPINNANWDLKAERIYLGDGDGTYLGPLGNALDVLVHETTHAVVDSEVRLPYRGQSGGINESWADVLGALADPDDWLIGEDAMTPGIPGDAIRDLAAPVYAHLRDIPAGSDDVHDLSGIPSLAAVRVADKLGRSEMGRIWYTALVDHLHERAGFSGAARATLKAATSLYGETSPEFAAVRDAWKSVGVDPRWHRASNTAPGRTLGATAATQAVTGASVLATAAASIGRQ